jgi:hypothetical protein
LGLGSIPHHPEFLNSVPLGLEGNEKTVFNNYIFTDFHESVRQNGLFDGLRFYVGRLSRLSKSDITLA